MRRSDSMISSARVTVVSIASSTRRSFLQRGAYPEHATGSPHRCGGYRRHRFRGQEGRYARVLAVRRLAARRTQTHPPWRAMPHVSRGPPCLPAVPAPCTEDAGRMRSRSRRPSDRQGECELLHVLSAGTRDAPERCRRAPRPRARRARGAVRPCGCRGTAAARGARPREDGREGAPRARSAVSGSSPSRSRTPAIRKTRGAEVRPSLPKHLPPSRALPQRRRGVPCADAGA